ncbi:branched-chain amino acid ABC transporter substrate-binding protein [soil metagenome]
MALRIVPLLVLAAFITTGFLIPAPPNQADDTVIKIVSSLPRTGSAKGQTDTIVDGIRLALDEYCEHGEFDKKPALFLKVGDKKYRVLYEDLDDATVAAGQWTVQKETDNAQLARSDKDVMVYIGTYNSGAAKISMPILNIERLLMISPANTAPGLTKPNVGERDEPKRYRPSGEPNFCRVVATDDLQGPAGAEWAEHMGMKRIYILDDNEVYGKGVADFFESHAKKIGLEILGRESIDANAQEFSSLMTKIKRLNPDMVYFGGTTQTKAGQIFKDIDASGMTTVKMMAPDGCYEQAMIDSAGAKLLDGRFFATFCGLSPDKLDTTPGGKKFIDNYKAKFGKPPSEAYALYGYECGRVAIEAIKKAGVKDRAAICKAGLGIRDFDGVTGKWSFDENGDTTLRDLTGVVVKNGEFVFSKSLTVTKK